MAGPYDTETMEANGQPLLELGTFADMIRNLQRDGEVSEDLKAVLAAAS